MKIKLAWLPAMGLAALGALATSGVAQTGAAPGERQLQIVENLAAQETSPVPPESALTAYLLVYFRDETHSLHIAVFAGWLQLHGRQQRPARACRA